MTNDIQQIQTNLTTVLEFVKPAFWVRGDFWINVILAIIGIVIGGFGIFYARKAFVEAEQAKDAANAAGRTVKCLTVAIELTELLPKLGTPPYTILYEDARNLLSDTTQRLHRILAPFENDSEVKDRIGKLWRLLEETRLALDQVRPHDQAAELQAPQAVYNATERHFANINDLVSDLVGLFEQKTTKFGENNAR